MTDTTTTGGATTGEGETVARERDVPELTEQTRIEARELISRYPQSRSALLPLLHLVQSVQGYVSPEGVGFCAQELGLTKAEVGAVATFYTMYKRRPNGEYLVSVCTNTLCGMLGGDEIFSAVKEHLGIGNDQTTPDGRVTIEHAECLAACDYAPVLTVNYEFFDQMTQEKAVALTDELIAGRLPVPTRGAPLCTFKEIERQLAGFGDDRPDVLGAGPAGEPTLVGVRAAAESGQAAPDYPGGGGPGGGAAPVPVSVHAPRADDGGAPSASAQSGSTEEGA